MLWPTQWWGEWLDWCLAHIHWCSLQGLLTKWSLLRSKAQTTSNSNLNGINTCYSIRSTCNKDNCSLEKILKKKYINKSGKIHKKWTAAGISALKATKQGQELYLSFLSSHKPETITKIIYPTWGEKKDLDCCSVFHRHSFRWK